MGWADDTCWKISLSLDVRHLLVTGLSLDPVSRELDGLEKRTVFCSRATYWSIASRRSWQYQANHAINE